MFAAHYIILGVKSKPAALPLYILTAMCDTKRYARNKQCLKDLSRHDDSRRAPRIRGLVRDQSHQGE